MKKLFSKLLTILASILSWLVNRKTAGKHSAKEHFTASKNCKRHPDNGGKCQHHWICDKMENWERCEVIDEIEYEDRIKHKRKAHNDDRTNYRTRSGSYGAIL